MGTYIGKKALKASMQQNAFDVHIEISVLQIKQPKQWIWEGSDICLVPKELRKVWNKCLWKRS